MLLAARRTTLALARQGHKHSAQPFNSSRKLATQSQELDGVVLTYTPDLDLWSLSTKNQDERIKDFKRQFLNGEVALDEEFFDAPFSRLGKPSEVTSDLESSWVYNFLENGNVDQALSALEKNKPRLHDYEILVWGLIGTQPTSAGVQKVLNHAVSKQVPLTTTFLGQVIEGFVAANDFEAAAKLFEEAQSKYKLPVTQELLHKFIGLFQLNKKYQTQVAEAQKRLASTTRSRDFSDLKASNLEEVDPVLYDPLLNVSADKEKQILKDFAADLLVQTPFEAGMKEWKRRVESYVQWHKAEETSALEELKRDNVQLIHKYEKRNEQIRLFLEKKFGAQPQLGKN